MISSKVLEAVGKELKTRYPEIPDPKVWIKGERHRIYFNEKIGDENYTFNLDFKVQESGSVAVFVWDLNEEYWNSKLEIEGWSELKEVAQEIFEALDL